ncbi:MULTISPECIES: c-type cytochrome biogenesis protein CcmI [Pseudoalteromonas]|uniref:c-type cytochrome biogenesis protein CcmI n=2 Tax=Pseudoalteromonas TaxID=53246 RepID=UPI000C7BA075|nr:MULTISPECIES: c-type cytochrome biogenesis protein CcmI [Pseudoalteromonas]MCF7515057.1 c-type cytochrome biogenesis protein CcmI [Pseudoalteromonas sp. L7]MCF7527019.1 c-type cytochrome biogenesis protein CcmI [Pseudoalteromonas sp. L23]MCG7552533.1 c-type cytochrome biogenesis protein CcmI [Pseudoalteromonas sp. Of11M-6]NSY32189.1 c-type cytochrome biogenesis protein CcmI [Pseudoalteromonas sp. JC28]AUJ69532.1 Cytochrome c-type biogenesis protein CcmH precursor [Pseudoalteromonas sp. NC20
MSEFSTDLTQMWFLFLLLGIFAGLFVVFPFIKKEKRVTVDHDANAERIDIFHQRLEELKEELANQRIEKDSYNESVVELKRRLLNELSPEQSLTSRGDNRVLALTGIAFMVLVTGVFYYYTGSHRQIASWHEAVEKLPEYGERAVMQSGEPLNANELQAFALGLRTKLATAGDDAVAWMLLGRVAMSLSDFEMAMQAFDKALVMQPNNNNVLVNYSQALLIEGSEPSMNRAARMLSKVLKNDPTNIDAISLLALIAYERQDWKESKAAFEVLLSQLTKDDPRYEMIAGRIAEIEQKLGQQTDEPVAVKAGIVATVTISAELQNKIPKDSTLFVFAKAAEGPAMPLAVAKITNFNLPMTVNLDDSMAMMPELTLSKFSQVTVTARISNDGSVMPSDGELEGASSVIELQQGENQLTVEISRVLTNTGK